MIDKNQLRDLIDNTLLELGGKFYSEEAVALLMGTAAVESALGTYIRQIRGPALGIFQMEPATYKDHLGWIYAQGNIFSDRLFDICNIIHETNPENVMFNLKAATLFSRIHYFRKPGAIPTTVEGQAEYWKKYYNTYLGAGTVAKYIESYKKYVL